MAPQSAPAKGLQQNRPRPIVPRAIIPAIPLPYVQKRKQQEAARAKARGEEITVAVVAEAPSITSPKDVEVPQIVNISGNEELEKVEEPAVSAFSSTPATPGSPEVEVPEVVEQNKSLEKSEVSTNEEIEGQQTSPLLL